MLPFFLRTLIYNAIRQEYEKRTHSNHIEIPAVLQGAPSSSDTRNMKAFISAEENEIFRSIQLSNIICSYDIHNYFT